MDELPVQDSCLVAAGEQPRRLPGHSISGGRWPACDLEVGTLSARWLAPDVADGRDVVRMAEVGRGPEPVLDRTPQAVMEGTLGLTAGQCQRVRRWPGIPSMEWRRTKSRPGPRCHQRGSAGCRWYRSR